MNNLRVAWVYPSIVFGAYWQPVIQEFLKRFSQTIFYTGQTWPDFDPEDPGVSAFRVVGNTQYVLTKGDSKGYDRGFIYASPKIIFPLLKFRPHVIFASAFSIWTVLVLLFKFITRWQVIIIYDGSSPNTEFRDSFIRSRSRKIMARFTDAFVANSQAAESYLIESLGVERDRVFTTTYLVPDTNALINEEVINQPLDFATGHPTFLFVGQVIPRKGIQVLLKACVLLRERGYENFSLVIVGDGEERQNLEDLVQKHDLSRQVFWAGWIHYNQLGSYFQNSDVFVFPSLEDVWGMAVLEAMAFGKPILCSRSANACEMVMQDKNGYVFDPQDPVELADMMAEFIKEPSRIATMGAASRQIISSHTPAKVAESMTEIILKVMK
ncbi:MAG: glycosyl transferase [Leptolyngbya sp. ERB_1_1]